MSNRIVNAHVDGAKLTENNVEVNNLVVVENSPAVTTSLKVAEVFGKRHADVLRAVSNLECSEDFRERNFAFIQKISDLGNGRTRKDPMYLINRDGFIFLVMGFTGKTAAKWKEAYINAFNAMEAKLRESHHVGMQSFIAPVSKTTNAMALTLSNLNRLQEDYVRRLYELEKKGYAKADEKANEFSYDFMKIRDDILYLIINEEIYGVECYGNGIELLQNMRNSQDELNKVEINEK